MGWEISNFTLFLMATLFLALFFFYVNILEPIPYKRAIHYLGGAILLWTLGGVIQGGASRLDLASLGMRVRLTGLFAVPLFLMFLSSVIKGAPYAWSSVFRKYRWGLYVPYAIYFLFIWGNGNYSSHFIDIVAFQFVDDTPFMGYHIGVAYWVFGVAALALFLVAVKEVVFESGIRTKSFLLRNAGGLIGVMFLFLSDYLAIGLGEAYDFLFAGGGLLATVAFIFIYYGFVGGQKSGVYGVRQSDWVGDEGGLVSFELETMRVAQINVEASALFEVDRDTSISKPVFDVFGPFEAILHKCEEAQYRFKGVVKVDKASGETLYFDVRSERNRRSFYGDIVTISFRDMSAYYAHYLALQSDRALLDGVVRQMDAFIFVLDDHARFVFCNEGFAEVMNTVPEDLIGKVYWDVLNAKLAKSEALSEYISDFRQTFSHFASSGILPEKWEESTMVPSWTWAGRPDVAFGSRAFVVSLEEEFFLAMYLVDITTHMNARSVLRQDLTQLERVLVGSGMGYWEYNHEDGSLYLSRKFAQFFFSNDGGWLRGGEWGRLIGDESAAVQRAIQLHVEGDPNRIDITFQVSGDPALYLRMVGSALSRDTQTGIPAYVSGMICDVTAPAQTLSELRSFTDHLSNLVSAFRHAVQNDKNLAFNEFIGRMLSFASIDNRLDRVTLIGASPDQGLLFEWVDSDGVPPLSQEGGIRLNTTLFANGPVIFSEADSGGCMQELKRQASLSGVKAFLLCPVYRDGELYAAVYYQRLLTAGEWSSQAIDQLGGLAQYVGDTYAGAKNFYGPGNRGDEFGAYIATVGADGTVEGISDELATLSKVFVSARGRLVVSGAVLKVLSDLPPGTSQFYFSGDGGVGDIISAEWPGLVGVRKAEGRFFLSYLPDPSIPLYIQECRQDRDSLKEETNVLLGRVSRAVSLLQIQGELLHLTRHSDLVRAFSSTGQSMFPGAYGQMFVSGGDGDEFFQEAAVFGEASRENLIHMEFVSISSCLACRSGETKVWINGEFRCDRPLGSGGAVTICCPLTYRGGVEGVVTVSWPDPLPDPEKSMLEVRHFATTFAGAYLRLKKTIGANTQSSEREKLFQIFHTSQSLHSLGRRTTEGGYLALLVVYGQSARNSNTTLVRIKADLSRIPRLTNRTFFYSSDILVTVLASSTNATINEIRGEAAAVCDVVPGVQFSIVPASDDVSLEMLVGRAISSS